MKSLEFLKTAKIKEKDCQKTNLEAAIAAVKSYIVPFPPSIGRKVSQDRLLATSEQKAAGTQLLASVGGEVAPKTDKPGMLISIYKSSHMGWFSSLCGGDGTRRTPPGFCNTCNQAVSQAIHYFQDNGLSEKYTLNIDDINYVDNCNLIVPEPITTTDLINEGMLLLTTSDPSTSAQWDRVLSTKKAWVSINMSCDGVMYYGTLYDGEHGLNGSCLALIDGFQSSPDEVLKQAQLLIDTDYGLVGYTLDLSKTQHHYSECSVSQDRMKPEDSRFYTTEGWSYTSRANDIYETVNTIFERCNQRVDMSRQSIGSKEFSFYATALNVSLVLEDLIDDLNDIYIIPVVVSLFISYSMGEELSGYNIRIHVVEGGKE